MRDHRTAGPKFGALIALTLGAALLLSGCSSSIDPEASEQAAVTGGGPGGGSTEAGRPADDAADADGEADAEAEPAEPATEALAGAACLTGSWVVDNEHFGELMSSVSGSAVDDIEGVTTVTFRDDGTTTTHYDEWQHTITMDSATVTIVKDGEDSGVYEVAEDGSMTLTDTDLGATTTSQMTMGGQTVAHQAPPQPSVFSRATFRCEGDALTVTAEGATTILHRED